MCETRDENGAKPVVVCARAVWGPEDSTETLRQINLNVPNKNIKLNNK